MTVIDLDAARVERLQAAVDGVRAIARVLRPATVSRLSAAINDLGLDLAKEGTPVEAKLVCALSQMFARFDRRRKS